jgi:hypothetical protein
MQHGSTENRGFSSSVKYVPTSERCFVAREFEESLKKGPQMTVEQTGAPGDLTQSWEAIDWQKARAEVRRRQMRIAKAVKEKKQSKVNALQWI